VKQPSCQDGSKHCPWAEKRPWFHLISCGGADTGSCLRTRYVKETLTSLGFRATMFQPPATLPAKGDFLITTVTYVMSTLLLLARAGKWDYLLVNKAYPNALIPALITKLIGGRVILDIDDLDEGFHQGLMARFIRLCQFPMPRIADYLCTHSPFIAKSLEEAFPGRPVLFLRQGVAPELLETDALAGLEKRREFCPNAQAVVLYTAHMNVASEFPAILDIFQAARQISGMNCVLLAPGGGPKLQDFRNLVRERGLEDCVILPGYFHRSELSAWNSAADLCLVYYPDSPSNRARVSMKVREHLAAGRVTLCNRVGDLASMEGLAILGGDSREEMTEALVRALKALPVSDRGPRGQVRPAMAPSEELRLAALDRFSWRRTVAEFLCNLGENRPV